MPINITIDGPVGAGKSSVASEVAKRLNILHLDTGAMYRALAYACQQQGVNPSDEKALSGLLNSVSITVEFKNATQQTFVNGLLVNDFIRTPQMSMLASHVSKIPAVRQKLVALQRQIASMQDVVVDGRDIGTNVLPFAKVKIFLTASATERAKRRFEQNSGGLTFQQIYDDLIKRDEQDTSREINPLKKADDATLLDTTALTFEESVDAILNLVRNSYES